MITLILASDLNGCIGKDNKLPWKDKEEMKHFRRYTLGKTVIMGMNTWKSLNYTPLKDRTNIVCVDGRKELDFYNTHNVLTMPKEQIINLSQFNPKQELVVIGGAKTYELFEDVADVILWSRGNFIVEGGDSYYIPPIDNGDWIERETSQISDQFTLHVYQRNKPQNESFIDKALSLVGLFKPSITPRPMYVKESKND